MERFRFVFSPFEVNTYLLADKSGLCAVLDCSCYDSREFARLADFIDRKGFKPVLLLNTHCHLDHIFGSKMFLERYGIGAHCHMDGEKNRKNAVKHGRLFGVEMEDPPEPAGFLTDGQEISFGDETLTVIHVPGHAPESIAFYSSKDGVVFTGDTLFAGSVGRTDLLEGDHEQLISSIRTRLFVLPPATVVYPGHGEATTIGTEMDNNPYFRKK